MSESTETPATVDPADPVETDPAGGEPTPAPPWGSADEFDPEKAWNLIQNLRTENTEVKDKNRAFEDAKLSAEGKAARDLEELQTNFAQAQTQNARLQALVDNPGLQAEDLELIAGSTPEEIQANAAKLAARLGSGTTATTPPASGRPQRVVPRGGADPSHNQAPEPTDWLRAAIEKSKE